MPDTTGEGVLLIYTGGTIGSVRQQPDNPDSPLRPAEPEVLLGHLWEIRDSTIVLENRPVRVDLVATEQFIDSALITPEHWVEIASIIEDAYDEYEGFVILHGTDTMAYTASALAFMFDHLGKPVILTGAQRPIGETRSDAVQNVITAIEFAAAHSLGHPVVPEVCIYFNNELLRGCRATKYDADAYAGFTTPNYPALALAGSQIEIYEELVRPWDGQALEVRSDFDRGVAVLELSPLMTPDLFDRVLSAEGLHGVILKAYGAGNAPKGRFLDIVQQAVERGVRIVDVTQCYAGTVRLGHYDVSAGLLERGVISGVDMTPEAAQTKLSLLLADDSLLYPPEEMMQVNLRGEMDESLFDLRFGGGAADPELTVVAEGSIPAVQYYDPNRLERATLRLTGVRAPELEQGELCLSFHLNPRGRDRAAGFCGRRTVQWDRSEASETTVFLDITHAVRKRLETTKRNRLTVVVDEGGPVSFDVAHIALFTR